MPLVIEHRDFVQSAPTPTEILQEAAALCRQGRSNIHVATTRDGERCSMHDMRAFNFRPDAAIVAAWSSLGHIGGRLVPAERLFERAIRGDDVTGRSLIDDLDRMSDREVQDAFSRAATHQRPAARGE